MILSIRDAKRIDHWLPSITPIQYDSIEDGDIISPDEPIQKIWRNNDAILRF